MSSGIVGIIEAILGAINDAMPELLNVVLLLLVGIGPLVDIVNSALGVVAPLLDSVTGLLGPILNPVLDFLAPFFAPVLTLLRGLGVQV